ncbi:MAG: cytochrome P450 [Proteobacteria bacterium]|nr:MAG: cytochrome P450 [Pseudomonadota bacterium]
MSIAKNSQRHIVESFDPRAPGMAFYADPYPTYHALRELSPVHHCPDDTYFITRHGDLNRIYRDPKTFSSAKEAQFKPLFGDSPLFEHHTTSLVFSDPPLHTNVRKAIGDALAPRVIAAMEQRLVVLVDGLLDELEDRTTFDLIDDFASVIPLAVIGNLLDVAPEDRGPLRAWSAAILGALEFNRDQNRLDEGNRSVVAFAEFLLKLIAIRRKDLRGDDIITRLVRWTAGDFRLSDQQIVHQCIFLLNAGHETTTNLIGNGVHALLTHPAIHREVAADISLMGSAVEEFLRFDSPVQLGNRITTTDVEFDRIRIPQGTILTLCIGAANRDPDIFRDPDELNIRRSPNPHLAFAGGIHACAGMAIARLEARIAIARLLTRFPGLRLDGTAERTQRARFRGFLHLPMHI